jgi:hypothetical protein
MVVVINNEGAGGTDGCDSSLTTGAIGGTVMVNGVANDLVASTDGKASVNVGDMVKGAMVTAA